MGFLFRTKKREEVQEDKVDIRLKKISGNLKHSFLRIKSDIMVIRDWLSYFKTRDEYSERRFKDMESRIEEMGQVISYLAAQQNLQEDPKPFSPRTRAPQNSKKEEPYYVPPSSPKMIPGVTTSVSPIEGLTETQRVMFFRLGTIQKESGLEWMPIKTLAHDLYPGKPYDKVRSTISEYVGLLVDAGLIEKSRKGKQTYVKLSRRGASFFKREKGDVSERALKAEKKPQEEEE